MQVAELSLLTQQVLWAAFAVSLVFGAIVQRTHFCAMGAVSDIVNMGDWTRMRQWVLAMGVAIVGFALMARLGWIDASKALYAVPRWNWLSALVGGLMFGVGMVLASGCGSKTLVRLGAGNLKSLVVFVVMGLASFATLKGLTSLWRVATVDRVGIDLAGSATLGPLLARQTGLDAQTAGLVCALLVGGALVVWALAASEARRVDSLLAGLGVAGGVLAMWWVSGHLGHIAEHPETLEETFLRTNSGRMESLTFTAPMAYALDWLMFTSDRSKVLTLGVVSVVGVVLGSTVQSLASRSFRWEGFAGTEDLANHLVGAVLMGVGGVTAMGCTVGQGLSAMSTLSLGSFVTLPAIIAGAVIALRYQVWRLERIL